MKSTLIVLLATAALAVVLGPATMNAVKGQPDITAGPSSLKFLDAEGGALSPTNDKDHKRDKKRGQKHRDHHDD